MHPVFEYGLLVSMDSHPYHMELSTPNRVGMFLWHRGKTKINPILSDGPPNTRIRHEPTFRLPYGVVEMITAHLTSDLDTL